jgi:hypothetical protein
MEVCCVCISTGQLHVSVSLMAAYFVYKCLPKGVAGYRISLNATILFSYSTVLLSDHFAMLPVIFILLINLSREGYYQFLSLSKNCIFIYKYYSIEIHLFRRTLILPFIQTLTQSLIHRQIWLTLSI